MKNNISYGEVMEVYSRPISIRYIPRIFVCIFLLTVAFISTMVLVVFVVKMSRHYSIFKLLLPNMA